MQQTRNILSEKHDSIVDKQDKRFYNKINENSQKDFKKA